MFRHFENVVSELDPRLLNDCRQLAREGLGKEKENSESAKERRKNENGMRLTLSPLLLRHFKSRITQLVYFLLFFKASARDSLSSRANISSSQALSKVRKNVFTNRITITSKNKSKLCDSKMMQATATTTIQRQDNFHHL